jgi:hypothetical protein
MDGWLAVEPPASPQNFEPLGARKLDRQPPGYKQTPTAQSVFT